MGETCGDREAGADAERAKRPWIHPLAGPARAHCQRRDRHDIATVTDIDRVVCEKLVKLVGNPIRVDRRVVGLEQRHELFTGSRFGVSQFLHPLPAGLALVLFEAAGGGLQDCAQNGPGVADQPQIDIPVLADGAVVHVDLHERELRADAASVAHAEVERRAHDDNDIGVGERVAASPIEVMRIARRQQPAAATVEITGDVEAT